MKLKLDSDNPKDNFKKITDTFNKSPFLKGDFIIRVFEIPGSGPILDMALAHGLSFVPKDFIITRGLASISRDADEEFIYINVTAPATVRIAIGTWSE